ncbi:hypothetical protein DPMN_049279 [Dreissena polymorpha]|uniref:Uncharacterized protein n=1 Tax=Dreissena polymorpha TaxID=45954 RepID=A0A9D4HM00_DREPO|nr:hypothetical protein DPMN_049279 [Dreissena polymorpha]
MPSECGPGREEGRIKQALACCRLATRDGQGFGDAMVWNVQFHGNERNMTHVPLVSMELHRWSRGIRPEAVLCGQIQDASVLCGSSCLEDEPRGRVAGGVRRRIWRAARDRRLSDDGLQAACDFEGGNCGYCVGSSTPASYQMEPRDESELSTKFNPRHSGLAGKERGQMAGRVVEYTSRTSVLVPLPPSRYGCLPQSLKCMSCCEFPRHNHLNHSQYRPGWYKRG